MTQSLHSQGPRLQSLHSMQYTMAPPEMTQSLHAQASRENNLQNIPGAGENMQYGLSAADQLSHLQMLQRFSMQPSYQFIEDYENISLRLTHNKITSRKEFVKSQLIFSSISSSSITPEFNEFVQNSQMQQSSLQKSLIQTKARQSPTVIKSLKVTIVRVIHSNIRKNQVFL